MEGLENGFKDLGHMSILNEKIGMPNLPEGGGSDNQIIYANYMIFLISFLDGKLVAVRRYQVLSYARRWNIHIVSNFSMSHDF